MESQHDKREQHIQNRHKRCHDLRHVGDALHASHHHQADEHGDNSANPYGIDMIGVRKRHRDAVGLHRRQEKTRGQYRTHGKDHSQPLAFQSFLDIIGRTATKLAFVLLLIDLCQGSLGKGRTCTQESDNPHPDDGTRAAITDGRGHSHDIARAHTPRKRHRKRLKRGDACLLALFR